MTSADACHTVGRLAVPCAPMPDTLVSPAVSAPDTSATSSLIRARGLTKKFGEFTAVDAVDFDVAPGESFGFLARTAPARRPRCG